MYKKIRKLSGEEIFRGGIVLLIMVNIFNFLNYLFHFSMARLLTPADYGVLAVLMSLVYIFTIQGEGIQTIVSRYTTRFNIKKQYGKIKYLLVRSLKKIDPSVNVIAISGGGKISGDYYLSMIKTFRPQYTFPKPIDIDALLSAVHNIIYNGEN